MKVPLGQPTLNQKKTKLKLVKTIKKGTKESKLSLGSWLVVWAANEICAFLAEFKSLKNEKKKLPYEQALDLRFRLLAKMNFFT